MSHPLTNYTKLTFAYFDCCLILGGPSTPRWRDAKSRLHEGKLILLSTFHQSNITYQLLITIKISYHKNYYL